MSAMDEGMLDKATGHGDQLKQTGANKSATSEGASIQATGATGGTEQATCEGALVQATRVNGGQREATRGLRASKL